MQLMTCGGANLETQRIGRRERGLMMGNLIGCVERINEVDPSRNLKSKSAYGNITSDGGSSSFSCVASYC